MTDSDMLKVALGGLAAVGGLGYGIYNQYSGSKKIDSALNSMKNYNGRIRNSGLSASDPDLIKLLKTEIGTKVPVAVVSDKDMIRDLGIGDNAFYVSPNDNAREYTDWIDDPTIKPKDVDKYGAVVLSDKFGSLPILAHELGHAKDYEEGNLPNSTVTNIGSLLGTGLGLAAFFGIPNLDIWRGHHPMTPVLTGAGSALAIAAITSWWRNRRVLGAESRASDKAKAAILRVAEKLNKQKELGNTDKLLDRAFSTYETAAKTERNSFLASALRYGGVLTLLSGLAGK